MEALIGENAGKVWRSLKEKGPQSATALAKSTRLKISELDRALGWLAREGKLTFTTDNKGTIKIGLQ